MPWFFSMVSRWPDRLLVRQMTLSVDDPLVRNDGLLVRGHVDVAPSNDVLRIRRLTTGSATAAARFLPIEAVLRFASRPTMERACIGACTDRRRRRSSAAATTTTVAVWPRFVGAVRLQVHDHEEVESWSIDPVDRRRLGQERIGLDGERPRRSRTTT